MNLHNTKPLRTERKMTMQLKLSLVKTESSEEGEMACMNDSLRSEGIIL